MHLQHIVNGLTTSQRKENAYIIANWKDAESVAGADVHRLAAEISSHSTKAGANP